MNVRLDTREIKFSIHTVFECLDADVTMYRLGTVLKSDIKHILFINIDISIVNIDNHAFRNLSSYLFICFRCAIENSPGPSLFLGSNLVRLRLRLFSYHTIYFVTIK